MRVFERYSKSSSEDLAQTHWIRLLLYTCRVRCSMQGFGGWGGDEQCFCGSRWAGTEGSWPRKSPVLIQLWRLEVEQQNKPLNPSNSPVNYSPAVFISYSAASKPNTAIVQKNQLSRLSLRRRYSKNKIQCLKNYANNAEMINNSFLNKSRTVIL